MPYTLKKNQYAFLLLGLFGWLLSIVGEFVLSHKFYRDADWITKGVAKPGFVGGYPLTALFYLRTGLGYLPYSLVAFLQFPVFMYILYKLGIPKDFHILTAKNIVVYLAVILIAVFISMPSKDFITFVYISLLVAIFKNKKINFRTAIVLSILMLTGFAVFRIYFFLMAFVGLCIYAFTFIKLKNRILAIFTYGLLIAIFLSLAQGIVKGEFLTETTRDFANDDRPKDAPSNSMIKSPVDAETWYGEVVSILYGFFEVNLPVSGLRHIFSPQVIAFIIWQFTLFYILLVRFSWALKNRAKYHYELWALCLVFAYFIMQGVFEPDLGSAVRHKIGIFPLIYYCLYYEVSSPRAQQYT